MKSKTVLRLARVAVWVFVLLPLSISDICGQLPQAQSQPQNSHANFADSSEDLQSQIAEILNALKAQNSARANELIHNLLMPENSPWFTEVYGPGFGASLARAYRQGVPNLEEEIKRIYEADARAGLLQANVSKYADPEAVNAPIDRFLNCMNKIVPLYEAAFQGNRPMTQMSLKPGTGNLAQTGGDLDGFFVFYQGGFRFIPMDILIELPSERPIRIHLGMNVMQSKLVTKVYPRYPEEALKKRLQGKVVVRLELDINGNLQKSTLIEGDPVLGRAFMEAVKQWRFEPTTLDGDPVEVEVDAETAFTVN
jgi:TonB family protein